MAGRKVALKLGQPLVEEQPQEMQQEDSLHYHRLEARCAACSKPQNTCLELTLPTLKQN